MPCHALEKGKNKVRKFRTEGKVGTVVKQKYTIPFPKNATVNGTKVSWIDPKGKKKTGKLTENGRVQTESENWQIRYRDENKKEVRESTQLKSKESAQKLLAVREAEIERIVLKIATREEINGTLKKNESLSIQIEKFGKNQFSEGAGQKHIEDTKKKIEELLAAVKIDSIQKVTAEIIKEWIADERKKGVRAPRTINSYFVALNSFINWAVESERLPKSPFKKKIKKLNEAVDRRKQRRSLTEDELKRLFEIARNSQQRSKKKREQIELAYRVLVGTGLRSKELSLATPSQFDFDRNLFRVRATATKNKKEDVLPMRPDLAAALKSWIDQNRIGPMERIFSHNTHSIYWSFRRDCEDAGIERISPDGRSIDVHSLRRTFGTMLARAGVPLTTTQRLMRHSTPELTAKLYIDVEPIDMLQAVEKLPTF